MNNNEQVREPSQSSRPMPVEEMMEPKRPPAGSTGDPTINSRMSDSTLEKPDREELIASEDKVNFVLPEAEEKQKGQNSDMRASFGDTNPGPDYMGKEENSATIPGATFETESVKQGRQQFAQQFETQGINNYDVPPPDQNVPVAGE